MNTTYVQSALLMPLLLVAALSDLRSRFISNRLVGVVAVVGAAVQTWCYGLSGAGLALTSATIGLVCLLPLYLLGGMAAGDVKLMAATGLWLSPATMALVVMIVLKTMMVISMVALMMQTFYGVISTAFYATGQKR
jgi:prepilin peptidase CpaA